MEFDETDTLVTLKVRRRDLLGLLVTKHQGRISPAIAFG